MGFAVKIVDREFIGELLCSVITENNGVITLGDMEKYLDEVYKSGKMYMSFEDRALHWHLEDHAIESHSKLYNIHKGISKLDNDTVTITFEPKCTVCEGKLEKVDLAYASYLDHSFRCTSCEEIITFRLEQVSKVKQENLDDE